MNVIMTNTHLLPGSIAVAARSWSSRTGRPIELLHMNVPLDELLRRNRNRAIGDRCPAEYIRNMYDLIEREDAWWRGEQWTKITPSDLFPNPELAKLAKTA